MDSVFENRRAAGRELAAHLRDYAGRADVTVLALPRGGVPVAFEVAQALHAPLDILVVRKLGLPDQPELAMGAIGSGGAFYLDERIVAAAGVGQEALDRVIARERAELVRRETLYRDAQPPPDLSERVAIVVDDGMATGATLRAAALSLRHARTARPARIVAALPVAPLRSHARCEEVVDDFVCVLRPLDFFGVGQFYADFTQTSDDEVRALLAATR